MESGYVNQFDAESFAVASDNIGRILLANEARVNIYIQQTERDFGENVIRGQE